jgi:hypothetical protein
MWVICRTKLGPFDESKDLFWENEKERWVPLSEATRFSSTKFLLPVGHGAVWLKEKDAEKYIRGGFKIVVQD